jgi:AraC family transcriptional regulator
METVQRLRLAQAAYRLTDAADSVTAVALNAGYDSPQAFARAFRGFTGVSPSEFKARQRHLSASHAGTALSAAHDTQAQTQTQAATSGNDLPSVELTELPPVDVLCLRHEGPVATIGQTFRALMRMLGCDGTSATAERRVGVCLRNTQENGSFRYLAAIVPAAPIAPVGAIEPLRLEGGLHATHRLVGPYALIAPTFRALFAGWLPQSGYVRDSRPALEFYRSSADSGLRHQCVTDLMISLRKE